MSRQLVDRGTPLDGIQETVRDHRVTPAVARALENFRMPDKRLRRRRGFEYYNDGVYDRLVLAKHTGSYQSTKARKEQTNVPWQRDYMWETPHSYGLIRWHDDFQPKNAREFTLGFWYRVGEDEPLVRYDSEPDAIWGATDRGFRRLAPSRPTPTSFHFAPRTISGCFLYDQSVIVNHAVVHYGASTITLPTNLNQSSGSWSPFDAVVIPAIAITYKKNSSGNIRYEFEFGILDKNTDEYYVSTGSYDSSDAYTEGAEHHVVITYRPSDSTWRLIVNGTWRANLVDVSQGLANWAWAGEEDAVNGHSYTAGRRIQRDITLLNECTVRGNYSSTCGTKSRSSDWFNGSGSWTNLSGNVWYTTCYAQPQAVFLHNTSSGIRFNGTEQTSTGSLIANYDWWFESGTNRLYVYYTANPGTSHNTEAIFYGIGGLNVIPHMTDYNISSASINQPNPWACSPPRGTAMWDLFILHDYIYGETISPVMNSEFTLPNEVGRWPLNDGGGILINAHDDKHGSVHHTFPQWVKDSRLLTGLGITFADNQYLLKSTKATDIYYVEDIQPYLVGCFGHDHYLTDYTVAPSEFYRTGDFTVQMQIITPYTFQDRKDKNTDSYVENGYSKSDGSDSLALISNEQLLNGNTIVPWSPPSYMQTLFSIEGKQQKTTPGASTDPDDRAIPLVQGLLDEEGYVHLHYYGRFHNGATGWPVVYQCLGGNVVASGANSSAGSGNTFYDASAPFGSVVTGQKAQVRDATGQELFIATVAAVSTTTLTLDRTWTRTGTETITVYSPLNASSDYALSFRCRTEDRNTGGEKTWLDIFIDDQHVGFVWINRSGYIIHQPDYSISVGAACVDDTVDESISSYELWDSVVGNQFDERNQKPESLKHGTQHFMTHRQDMPGFFTLGYFRLWATTSLDNEEIAATYDSKLIDRYYNQRLLFNIEPESITGEEVGSRASHPVVMQMGYKSFGASIDQPFFQASLPYISHIPLGWNAEDCLGWRARNDQNGSYRSSAKPLECRALAPYSSTLRQISGLVALMGDGIVVDSRLEATFDDGYIYAHGLLNEFSKGSYWQSALIGDKTLLFSSGGLPKVYNGDIITKAGLRRWNGGKIRAELGSGGSLASDTWYHLRLAYFDSSNSLISVSPAILLKTTSANRTIKINNYPEHPDPRVTSMRLYATPGVSKELAAATPPKLTRVGSFENNSIGGDRDYTFIGYNLDDGTLFPTVLDLDVISPPVCDVAASYNGRLVCGGNNLVPDAVFWSDAGNPEKFRLDARAVLEESSGDRVTAIIPAFGSCFVFKTNSIWKMDEVQPGIMQFSRIVEGIGAVSPRAAIPITIPETGQSAIFFWSKHGPYLFDGSRTIYLGFPIEQSFDDTSYSWLDSETVFITHNISDREIMVFYASEDSSDSRVDTALVFNYRFSDLNAGNPPIWYRYTGMVGTVGLNIAQFVDSTSSGSGSFSPAIFSNSVKSFVLLGGSNGVIYKWGSVDNDGLPQFTTAGPETITNVASYVLTVSGSPWGTNDMCGLWATIVKADKSNWFSIPILSNTTNTLTMDSTYGLPKFTPSVNDTIYIGQPPARILFPWDDMSVPVLNKELKEIQLWGEKDFYYRLYQDYEASAIKDFTLVANSQKKRKRVHNLHGINAEVFKLELVSFELDSRLDSYVYWVQLQGDQTLTP